MVGSALLRRLHSPRFEVLTESRDRLDLCDPQATRSYLERHRPDLIVMAAARVGGIAANQNAPVEFLADNTRITVSVLDAAYQAGVSRLVFLGSTCIYPRDCPQPQREDALLSGPLETSNEAYALSKIVGVKLCQYYRRQYGVMFHSVMPTNLYGPGDNYDVESGHAVAALIRRFHDAKHNGSKSVSIWGSGTPRRDWMHVDDLADAVAFLLEHPNPPDWVNIGTGNAVTVMRLAESIAEVVGFHGEIQTDPKRPDGTPVKCTDVTQLHQLGWTHRIDLMTGLRQTYQAFLREQESGQLRSHPKFDAHARESNG